MHKKCYRRQNTFFFVIILSLLLITIIIILRSIMLNNNNSLKIILFIIIIHRFTLYYNITAQHTTINYYGRLYACLCANNSIITNNTEF